MYCCFASGGDAPGMNAAIRAVVRQAISEEWKYLVSIMDTLVWLLVISHQLDASSVGDIISRGGTMLHSARYPELLNAKSIKRDRAVEETWIEGVVVIGGDGSYHGAMLS